MKSFFLRSLFVVFWVVTGFTYSYAQTTVNLPTIPCSNCNGPGAFATTAPSCTSGLVGAPLTMSWGAASGATSYTIMIATDAALSQDVATYTLTGTSLSVPAIALKPQTTYYWTVFANNATGSTKATGGVCTFSTNNTWTGTSLTGGFPYGTTGNRKVEEGIAAGYYTCQSGDGTCASGDNMVCNPQFKTFSATSRFAPNWDGNLNVNGGSNIGTVISGGGFGNQSGNFVGGAVNLVADGSIATPNGTQTAMKLSDNSGSGPTILTYFVGQQMYFRNLTSGVVNYKVSFWAKNTGANNPATIATTFVRSGIDYSYWNSQFGSNASAGSQSVIISTNWTQYTLNHALPASSSFGEFVMGSNGAGAPVYVTDVVVCKL